MSHSKSKKAHRLNKGRARSGQSNLSLYIVLAGFVLLAVGLFALWKVGQPAVASVPKIYMETKVKVAKAFISLMLGKDLI